MRPVHFEGVNTELIKPDSMEDEQCLSLPTEMGIDDNGNTYFLSAWEPNHEDIIAMREGRPLFLKIFGSVHPPICMFTVDTEGEGNF